MRLSSANNRWRPRWLVQGSLLVGLLHVASCSQDAAQTSSPQQNGCVAPNQICNGACADLTINPINCGACGVACVAGQTCQAGHCALNCVAPEVDCGGLCANPASNSLHCGGCNRPCPSGQLCQNSACVTGSCPQGQSLCNGACVDTVTNAMNCGVCGNACLVSQTCQAGVCTSLGGSGGMGTGGTGGIGTGGTAGVSTGGTAGAGIGGTAGMSTGGTAGMSTGGTAGMGMGGTPATGGAGQAGSGGSAGSGGKATSVPQSATCPNITWPTASGTANLGKGMTVAANQVYDGGMKTVDGSLDDCTTGSQDSVDPLIDVANGGTVRNVVFGRHIGDGIHCEGSCTIENVWFPYICDDAITILGGGTVTIRNSGFKNARDKTIQHNGTATVTIDNVYVETAGKLYRSCGDGCSSTASRSATLSNIVGIGVHEIAGVSENDRVTLRNICTYRTPSVCTIYKPGTGDSSTLGINGSDEGPNSICNFTSADTHALLSRVTGIPFTTETVCGGPNAYKSGSTSTACVTGFNKCLKTCMPGGYGFKEITCTNNRYAEGTGAICAFPTDTTAAQNLSQARVTAGASAMVNDNDTCSTEWGLGIETSNNANYCVCVHKPGYYQHDNWLAWDCQRRWW